MDANSLLAIVFIGLFILCGATLTVLYLVVKRLSEGTTESKTRVKILRPSSAPSLVSPPTETSTVEPFAGPDGVTHLNGKNEDTYKELWEVPRSTLQDAVDTYVRGGKEAVSDALDEVEK